MEYAAHFWYEADVVNGNAFNPLGLSTNADQPNTFYSYQSPSAQNDISELTVRLDPGDYRMSIVGTRSTTGAIQTIYLDNVLAATFDRYNAVGSDAILYRATVTIASAVTIVSSRAESQNGLSSGWDIFTTRIWFDKNGI